MSSFVRFALKHKKEGSAWGDVAKDIAMDEGIVRTWNWKRLEKYLDENRRVSPRVQGILEEMRDAWVESNKKKVLPKIDE
jgi:hypothetical protein